jgi:hypothetical protein
MAPGAPHASTGQHRLVTCRQWLTCYTGLGGDQLRPSEVPMSAGQLYLLQLWRLTLLELQSGQQSLSWAQTRDRPVPLPSPCCRTGVHGVLPPSTPPPPAAGLGHRPYVMPVPAPSSKRCSGAAALRCTVLAAAPVQGPV